MWFICVETIRWLMNKILLTGLALGKDIGLCPVCNYDFEWLLNNPSSLLWADKIIVPETIYQTKKKKKLLRKMQN